MHRTPGTSNKAGNMAVSSNRALAAAVAVIALTASNVVQQAEAHPNCVGDFAPELDISSDFCPNDNKDGFCCDGNQEAAIKLTFDAAALTGRCAEMYQEVRSSCALVATELKNLVSALGQHFDFGAYHNFLPTTPSLVGLHSPLCLCHAWRLFPCASVSCASPRRGGRAFICHMLVSLFLLVYLTAEHVSHFRGHLFVGPTAYTPTSTYCCQDMYV